MDAFLDDNTNYEPELDSTPNIDFQLNRFYDNEPAKSKHIPESALFTTPRNREWIKSIYHAGIDIPILLNGVAGCGKLTLLMGLINQSPIYLPDRANNLTDPTRINNAIYLKSLDREYPKLLCYENLFLVNIKTLNNNTEITSYIKYIHKLSRTRSIDMAKKIFIITHLEICNDDQQRYIAMMLDKITERATYLITTTRINGINRKITSSCACINFGHLDKTTFCEIFLANYKSIFSREVLTKQQLEKYYQIYNNNNYNIGNTIAQIKYILASGGGNDVNEPIMLTIVKNFIKKYMKLAPVKSALDIRRILYTLLSINIDLLEFCKLIISELLSSKLNSRIKAGIIERGGILSRDLVGINKDVIAVETFIYSLINIIYSGGASVDS